ncbi:MAG: DNA-binding protein [Gammaproteobacteria bacterium]
MKTVTLDVRSVGDTLQDFIQAWDTGEVSGPRISFETPALLFKVLTGKRWELLKAMTGSGPITIREAARRVGRDVKAVHGDMRALLDSGILQKTDTRRIVFPFDAVHVDFMLRAA